MRPSASDLIRLFNLQPLPVEGGLYRRTWHGPADAAGRPAGSCIYFLLTGESDAFSALHRLPADEIWHFYLGDPVSLVLLMPDGGSRHITLGPDVLAGQHVQYVVPAGVWMGAHLAPAGVCALLGCTMAPGFVDSDYEGGQRDDLLAQYQGEHASILRLTRPDAPGKRPPGVAEASSS